MGSIRIRVFAVKFPNFFAWFNIVKSVDCEVGYIKSLINACMWSYLVSGKYPVVGAVSEQSILEAGSSEGILDTTYTYPENDKLLKEYFELVKGHGGGQRIVAFLENCIETCSEGEEEWVCDADGVYEIEYVTFNKLHGLPAGEPRIKKITRSASGEVIRTEPERVTTRAESAAPEVITEPIEEVYIEAERGENELDRYEDYNDFCDFVEDYMNLTDAKCNAWIEYLQRTKPSDYIKRVQYLQMIKAERFGGW